MPIRRTIRTPVVKQSTLKVFDIPDALLLDHAGNPNEQDDSTLDAVAQSIKEDGFDEPLIVVPSLVEQGKYLIVSGHHRRKGGKIIGMQTFPCVIKQGWNEDKADMELVKRNNLRGRLNPEKFAALVTKMKRKGYDEAIIQAQMGFTKSDAYKKLLKGVLEGVPKAVRSKVAAAAEKVTSVDGLSSVINKIFTDHGADLNHGFLVFDFGNKTHHYIPTDRELNKLIETLEQKCRDEGTDIREVFKAMLSDKESLSRPAPRPVSTLTKVELRKPLRAAPKSYGSPASI